MLTVQKGLYLRFAGRSNVGGIGAWGTEINALSAVLRLKFSTAQVLKALRARFEKHVRLSPVIGIASILDPQSFVEDACGYHVFDIDRWTELFGEQLMKVIEDDVVRAAVAMGHTAEEALAEWESFTLGRTCSQWNKELRLCTKDAVDVKKWLFWTKTGSSREPPKPAKEVGLRAKLKVWEKMGKAVKDGEHEGFPILSEIALRALIVHATACSVERNWSAWKRLCKAERATMTLEHCQERMMIAEWYNGH